jgi:RNA polymerase sigma factor (sigma-70 family)
VVSAAAMKRSPSARRGVSDGPDPDRARFDQLYAEHFAEVYAYVARRRSGHDVPDLVAEVFARAWQRIEAVPPAPEDRLWLYGVGRRVLSQDERSTARRLALVNRLAQNRSTWTERPGGEQSDAPDATAQLRSLIEHLKPLDREVVRLVAWESLSHAEAAQVLGCSANAVAIRWHRSITRLRRSLTAKGDGGAARPREESHGV